MQTFRKTERLCSKVIIDQLFEKGRSFNSFPLKIIWMETPNSNTPAQVLLSVSKRLYKKAVDRNKIKRLMRESYRKNKSGLYESLGNKKISFIVLYLGKEIVNYENVEKSMVSGLNRLSIEANNLG